MIHVSAMAQRCRCRVTARRGWHKLPATQNGVSRVMSTVADDWFPRHRINVDAYYRMAEVGLLARAKRDHAAGKNMLRMLMPA